MALQARQPLRYGGVKSTWLDSLPDSGTEMLTISSTGVVSRQSIPVASFGALTGSPSDNAALQSALDAKLNLSGDTLTGQVTGTVFAVPDSANNVPTIRTTFNTTGFGFEGQYGSAINFIHGGTRYYAATDSGFQIADSVPLRFRVLGSTTRGEIWGTSASQIDVRANSGLRVRTLDGSAPAQVNCGSITSTGNVFLTGTYPYYGIQPTGWAGDSFYFQAGVDNNAVGSGNFTTFVNGTTRSFSFVSGNPTTTGRRHLTIDATTSNAVFGGAITASGQQTISRSSFSSYAPYLVCRNESGYSEAELQQGLSSGYGGTLTLRAGDVGNTGFLRLRYDAGYPKIETNNSSLTLTAGTAMMRVTGTYHDFHGNGGHWLTMDSQNFDKYNGTNPQTFRLYNTYTSATNGEWLQQQWSSNEARIGTAVGSAGGTQRNMVVGSWNTAGTWSPALTITPTGAITASGTITSGMQTLVADPSTVDITTGLNRMVKNTTSGEVRHWVNDGGTMKSVLLS